MRVRATATGFYNGNRYRAGQEFEVDAKAKSAWFESLEPAKPAKTGRVKPEAVTDDEPKADDLV